MYLSLSVHCSMYCYVGMYMYPCKVATFIMFFIYTHAHTHTDTGMGISTRVEASS